MSNEPVTTHHRQRHRRASVHEPAALQPPQFVPLDDAGAHQAVEAFIELLAAALSRDETTPEPENH